MVRRIVISEFTNSELILSIEICAILQCAQLRKQREIFVNNHHSYHNECNHLDSETNEYFQWYDASVFFKTGFLNFLHLNEKRYQSFVKTKVATTFVFDYLVTLIIIIIKLSDNKTLKLSMGLSCLSLLLWDDKTNQLFTKDSYKKSTLKWYNST